jgi:putative acetyltransferase
MNIRTATDNDLPSVVRVHEAAFGHADEASLVRALLADPSARPWLSLVAEDSGEIVGHVLFTAVSAAGSPAAILTPLAVMPDRHGGGIGTALVEDGLRRLREAGTGLVFVFGDPAYYRRFGFEAAAPHGLDAPYPIQPEYADAWMVTVLRDGLLGQITGRVRCANTLSQPELWQL